MEKEKKEKERYRNVCLTKLLFGKQHFTVASSTIKPVCLML
jgi:hypothetical protein